jgi:uncharacterized membrane protein YecN with MAPEG domain
MITGIYAALLALVYLSLSIRVINFRKRFRISLGDGNNPQVARAIRIHANFAEYVPFALILIYLIETQTSYRIFIHVLGMILLVARISHAYGLRSESADFRFRVGGMVLTFLVYIIGALALLAYGISSL